MQRYHGDLGVHAETPACEKIGCVLDDGSHDASHKKLSGEQDLQERYLSVCQELADVREALADERRRRLSFESLFSDIVELVRNQQRKP